jgi:cytoskeletal protein RodZ
MRFLSLPPLAAILLLAFLWVILLTLTLWFAFRPRRAPEAQHNQPQQDLPAKDTDAPAPPERPQVRVVREPRTEQTRAKQPQATPSQLKDTDQDDAFDSFRKRNGRRDDFDF